MKKKILFITPSLCHGGLERSLIMMLNLLDENKYEMYLYTYIQDLSLLSLVPSYVNVKNDSFDKHYNRNPKALILLIFEKFFGFIKVKSVSENLKRQRKEYVHQQKVSQPKEFYGGIEFDVVVANSIGIATEMAACVNTKKRFVFFHSSVDLHHDMLVNLFPKFDKIIAVSQGVKDMLCESYNGIDDKLCVIENYIDADYVINKSKEVFDVFNCYSNEKLIFATCGRISSEKGFDLAVESAKNLKKNGVDFVWYFVGDGEERNSIEQMIVEYRLSDIIITGFVDNPYPYIKNCDIYVQPSYHESYGLAIKEAVILGKPVVSTKTVGGKYILENGAKGVLTGFSGKSLADGIMSLIENPEKMQKLSNLYSLEDNQKEKIVYIEKWNELLS